MVPVAQSILADSFPPEKRGQAFALFGVAVVVAPVVGPTLGGWLADNFVLALVLPDQRPGRPHRDRCSSHSSCPSRRRRTRNAGGRGRRGFDLVGFVLVATFLGALEIMLDRGLDGRLVRLELHRRVPRSSCALAFVLMIPWEMRRRNPMIDVRMVGTRQFGACFVVMLATGAILLATTQFLPLLVQQDFGYTATWAGLVLSPGGLVTMAMMFVVGRSVGQGPAQISDHAGAIVIAVSMYDLTNVYADLGFWFFARSRMLLGVGLPLVFLPIMTASYDGIPPDKTDRPRR